MKYVVFDAEIKKAICGKGEVLQANVQYCEGWHDHAGMGISVIVAYTSWDDRVNVLMDDNRKRFADFLREADIISGFNILDFDNKLVQACWDIEVPINKCYDTRHRLIAARPGSSRFTKGYNLNQVCAANGLPAKTEDGAMAPVLWQQGAVGRTISYCIDDVWLETRVFQKCLDGTIKDPITGELAGVSNPRLIIPAQPLG